MRMYEAGFIASTPEAIDDFIAELQESRPREGMQATREQALSVAKPGEKIYHVEVDFTVRVREQS